MKQIRQGVFETNSSSTHSICIAKDAKLELPKEIHFGFGEFGWENNSLEDSYSKASYLYTGLMQNERAEDVEKLKQLMLSKGIVSTFEADGEDKYYYVDHGDELGGFLDAVCADESKMMSFLFSPLSFILTGNDNEDSDISINVSYEHDKYFKGN